MNEDLTIIDGGVTGGGCGDACGGHAGRVTVPRGRDHNGRGGNEAWMRM